MNLYSLLKGATIKHKKYRDVAFQVVRHFDVQGRYLKLKGYWVNQAFVESYVMFDARITIEFKDLGDWLICQNPNAKCIRYEKWMPITR